MSELGKQKIQAKKVYLPFLKIHFLGFWILHEKEPLVFDFCQLNNLLNISNCSKSCGRMLATCFLSLFSFVVVVVSA